MSPSTPILVVHSDAQFASRVVSALAERELPARALSSMAAALAQEAPSLLICAAQLDDGSAVELLAALEKRGQDCPAVLCAEVASVAECTAAMRAGVREFLVQPFSITELVESVERVAIRAPLPGRAQLRLSGTAEIESNARAVRELLAFLLSAGFASAARARCASATAEILENVTRHAYPDGEGRFRLEATLRGRQLRVAISDDGVGCDVTRISASGAGQPASCGLERARALSENLTLALRPTGGLLATLEFTSTSYLFADERGVDLSDLDYLEPTTARRVLASLGDDSAAQFQLSPALAVCVGRLLSASRPAPLPLTIRES